MTPRSTSPHPNQIAESTALVVRPFIVEVCGFADGTYYAKSRGQALSKAWSDYVSAYNDCRFGDFLKIARAYSGIGDVRFGDPITVDGELAFFLTNNSQYVKFVRPGSDVILSSHPYNVLPVEYRPSTYRREGDDREAASKARAKGVGE